MPTREIPREEWVAFFDQFSRQHRGTAVTIEVISDEIGAQVEAKMLPFEGIGADLKDRENRIEIAVADLPDHRITHAVIAPAGVWLKQTDEGSDEALEIKAADGAITLVRLSATLSFETLSAVLAP